MNGLSEIIDSLEHKFSKLLLKMESLEQRNQELQNELSKSTAVIHRQKDEITALQAQYENLKMANSLLGSEENKRETKLKINSLIREIDYCIAQLSE
ncbi:hypothetical protein [Flavobacterium cerinum]|uniref:Mis12-Mtw1 protein family n=1 Tax=Flavobacterium cerinum TaxID=2502784 RepID=A0ABY5IRR6_9FLAO|nr:hypothetical protein [Flavobacterium cerinum]UUC45538.1 hypothetical protein NOX80_18195 [Flavobacterium cerinum]